ncbi:MAG: Ig-like domain-containing protein [Myxococcota bacterium]
MRWAAIGARRGAWALVALAVALLLGACRRTELPAPEIEQVDPPFAYNGDDVLVSILGRNFYPGVAIDAWRGKADVDTSWSAWLVGPEGDIELERPLVGVGMRDDTELAATVAQGMPVGLYDVVIEAPSGAQSELLRSFTVTDTRADRLEAAATDGIVHPVTEPATVRLQVVDALGEKVAVPFPVSVTASLEDGTPAPVTGGTLEGAEKDGDGVTGSLVDGEGTVLVRSPRPGLVTLEATPVDTGSTAAQAPVARATLVLQFDPGDDLGVAIRLPVPADPTPEVEAGTQLVVEAELVDQYGNPSDATLNVALITDCSFAFPAFARLSGPTLVTVVPRVATSEDCPFDRVVVGYGPPGASALYTVRPGPVARFDVGLVGAVVQAGDQGVFTVIPEDQYGNAAPYAGDLDFELSTGAPFAPLCGPGPFPSWLQCQGELTVAATDQLLEVHGQVSQTDVLGLSDPFDVVADDVAMALDIEVAAGEDVVAGEPFGVEVTTRDAWGNAIDPAVLAADPIVLDDDATEVDCVEDGTTLLGAQAFACVLFTARTGAHLSATRTAAGLGVGSAAFDVVNGPLADVAVAGPASVVAGATAAFSRTATDAFGTAYEVQDDPVVDVSDSSRTLSIATATLGPAGTVTVTGAFTAAGPTTVEIRQAGILLGTSDPVQVLAGATSALALRPASPYAWVGEPLDVTVLAVDAYGNRTGYNGSATLSSSTTSAADAAVALVSGAGTVAYTWPEASFDEVLDAVAGPYAGTLALPVSARCAGPTADVQFGGFPDALGCVDAAGDVVLTADLSGSTAGAQPIVGYAVSELGGVTVTGATSALDLPLHGTGHHALRALVQDAASCGAEVSAEGWTGPDDGRAVGPVPLSTTAVMPNVFSTVTVDVTGVTDCARDPAALAAIEVRSTGGEPAAEPSGSGLLVTLDNGGDASFDVVMDGGLSAGDVEVHATTPDGAAAGLLVVPVVQDNVFPTVVAQDPAGLTAGTVSQVQLTFSEPLRSWTVAPAFAVTGPTAVTVTPTLLPGETEVLLDLSPAVDASAGLYTVTVPNTVRDAAGNRLDGTWAGSPADYVGAFGAGGAVPAGATCVATVPTGLVLRPDGDPGPGAEADVLEVSVSAAAAPAFWFVEVFDAADALVWQTRAASAGAAATLQWAARDRRGMVVPNGSYRVVVTPDDGLGNRGSGCEVALTVDNPLGDP